MTHASRRLCRLNCKYSALTKHRGVITMAAGLGFYRSISEISEVSEIFISSVVSADSLGSAPASLDDLFMV
ncbi:hypothetical protein EYF80_065079 [Liparis tanakae]|uniref:Uncharacterized protein n=1 Tax=Liparis tanakae TaxID=230148 RepID=A0A4Z2E7R0_9TELE|nr:hypothetical protein EYF80_065079 [Liparis tanakae]